MILKHIYNSSERGLQLLILITCLYKYIEKKVVIGNTNKQTKEKKKPWSESPSKSCATIATAIILFKVYLQ